MVDVKSPSCLMLSSMRSGRSALEAIENGCSRIAKGEARNVSQPNCPGEKRSGRAASRVSTSVQISPRSRRTSATRNGARRRLVGRTMRT